jgi:tRNA(Ile)-lysidine synthase
VTSHHVSTQARRARSRANGSTLRFLAHDYIPTARIKRLQSNVRRYLLDHAMRPADGRILVAVSGGPDSTALLFLLRRLSPSLRLDLHVAHFDHGLRGRAASAREERFVRRLAQSLGLPFTSGRGDVRSVARQEHLSIEQAARQERYAFLAHTAAEAGISAVATGHTASDQAETVLLHLVRGSGVAGLVGMGPVSPWPFPERHRLRLLRPLLRLGRKHTQGCCEDAGLKPLEDESNASPRFRRNRVRNELLPLMQEMNPRIEDALVRLAQSAAEDHRYIESKARGVLSRGAKSKPQRLDRWKLVQAPSSLRRYALRLALARLVGDLQEFNEKHFAALDRLVLSGKTGDQLDLPRDIVADLRRQNLRLQPAGVPPAGLLPEDSVWLTAPGFGRLGPVPVSVTSSPPPLGVWVEVDAEAVGDGINVRRRRDGDRFQPLGMRSTKKLQDFFVDCHVPRRQRDCVPLFETDRGIVWVGGHRIADWAKPAPRCPTLFLSYEPVLSD